MSKTEPVAKFGRQGLLRHWARDDSGVAIIEFAFIVPLMLLLAVGIMDLGMLMMKYRHASQLAASLAQTSAQLSIQSRDGSKGAANTLSAEQQAMLKNGLKLVMGEQDSKSTVATARRVIRSGKDILTDWEWTHGALADEEAFPVDKNAVMSQTQPGESLMVVDVSFTHEFVVTSYFGQSHRFTTHYTAGVPSY